MPRSPGISALVARVGLPPGDPDPKTVALVDLVPWWTTFVPGLIPAAVVAACVTAMRLRGGAAASLVIVTAVVGILSTSWVAGRRANRRWQATIGSPRPTWLVTGLTAEDLVIWGIAGPNAPMWDPLIVLPRETAIVWWGGRRIGSFHVEVPGGGNIVLDGDVHVRAALRCIEAGLDSDICGRVDDRTP